MVLLSGDDSDAFADDEAPSSDGMEERDDVSLVSTVSSIGEDDNYLSEPTYNNLDPLWAQRHGFGPGMEYNSLMSLHGGTVSLQCIPKALFSDNPLDIDAFSEEFDMRMRFGRGPSSTCSTIPRPTYSTGHPQVPSQHHHQHCMHKIKLSTILIHNLYFSNRRHSNVLEAPPHTSRYLLLLPCIIVTDTSSPDDPGSSGTQNLGPSGRTKEQL